MKTIKFFLISLLFVACSKDVINNSYNDSYIKLTAGSQQIEYSGSYTNLNTSGQGTGLFKFIGIMNMPTYYHLKGQNGINNGMMFNIVTDSLMEKTYNLLDNNIGGTSSILINGKSYFIDILNLEKQILSLTINNYSNGRVSGTFYGKMHLMEHNQTFPGKLTDISGEFKNIEVVY